jgi:hypothetical protein
MQVFLVRGGLVVEEFPRIIINTYLLPLSTIRARNLIVSNKKT